MRWEDFTALPAAVDELRRRLDTCERLMPRVAALETVVVRDSKLLGDRLYQKVFDGTIAAVSGTAVYGDTFDISQQSKDAAGNVVLPHAHYIVSAYTAAPARNVTYNGTLIVGSDLSVAIDRQTSAGPPTQYASRVVVYAVGANVDVHVQVLKLLGVR